MRKKLLIACFGLLSFSLKAQPPISATPTPFTEGNLVIYRFGDASSNVAGIVNGYFDEITPEGVLVRSVPLPTVADGDNRATKAGLFGQLREGLLSLSADGRYLTAFGVEGPLNGTGYADYPKVMVRVSGNGVVDTKTAIPTADAGNVGRHVSSVDGSGFYVIGAGSTGFIRYVPYGFNRGKQDIADFTSSYIIGGTKYGLSTNILNNQLYFVAQKTANSTLTGSLTKIDLESLNPITESYSPLKDTLRLKGSATDEGVELGGMTLPNQMVLFDTDVDGYPDLIYVLEGAASGGDAKIWKYHYQEAIPGTGYYIWGSSVYTHAKLKDAKAITGKMVADKVQLFVTTAPQAGKPTVVRVNNNIETPLNAITTTQGGTNTDNNCTTLMYASQNYYETTPGVGATGGATVNFRGIAFVPRSFDVNVEPEPPLPVKLASFSTEVLKSRTVRLFWETASENKNSHFEILRSVDGGKTFQEIGRVGGAGDSNQKQTYSFVDNQPMSGFNYYRLRQVDLDGQSEMSRVEYANVSFNISDLYVFVQDNQLKAVFNIEKPGVYEVSIVNIAGESVWKQNKKLEIGEQTVTVDVSSYVKGIYLLVLKNAEGINVSKFIR